MKTDYIKRERALDAFCKDCRGLERGKCEYYDNGCKTIETLLFVRSEAVVPKDFHDKTCEAMAKRHTEEIQRLMPKRGEWIDNTSETWTPSKKCSECGLVVHSVATDSTDFHAKLKMNFCPQCGADMRKESE